MRRLVFDLDDILADSGRADDGEYSSMLSQIEAYRKKGFEIVLTSAAGMIEYDGNVGKIPGVVAPGVFRTIEGLNLDYDELVLGKPDAGPFGLAIDDKAITPQEFLDKNYSEICEILDDV